MAKVSKAQMGKAVVKKKAAKDSVESEMNPGKMIPKSAITKGPYITTKKKEETPKKKMKSGGSLKAVPEDKKGSLGKLPTAVRNKMGFQKSGGKTKKASSMKMGGKCKYGC
jgi:hypothetical protein